MSSEYSADRQGGHGASAGQPYAGQGRPGEPQRPRRTGRTLLLGCLVTVAGGITLLVLLIGGMFLLFVASVLTTVSREGAGFASVALQELTVSGEPDDPKVVEIPVCGLLVSGGAAGLAADPVSLLEAMLRKAEEDPSVRGVILAVDSGGGGVTACDIMSKALRDFRTSTGVPVVALLEGVAASGAYYVACGADYVMAYPTTITGSIGVLMPVYNASGLLEKVGVSDRTVKSGPFKDMASLTASKTPAQWEREKAILEGLIMQMHERFVGVVARGRNMAPEAVRELADGRIYSSREAEENGLIDGVGYRQDAIDKVTELAGVGSVHVVRYRRTPSLIEVVLARRKGIGVGLELPGTLPLELQQRPMYLWRPPTPWPGQ